ncbi:unnamed protein product, partial [marine sediment metagenome]
ANLDIIKPEEITKQIKEEIFLYIDKILKQTKQEEARVSLNLIFPYRKIIDKKEVEMESRLEGFLLPTHGGFIIKVNSKYPLFRKRVTVAHEIGHTFFMILRQTSLSDLFQKLPQVFGFKIVTLVRLQEQSYYLRKRLKNVN